MVRHGAEAGGMYGVPFPHPWAPAGNMLFELSGRRDTQSKESGNDLIQ